VFHYSQKEDLCIEIRSKISPALNYLNTTLRRLTREWRYSSTIVYLGTTWRCVVSFMTRPLPGIQLPIPIGQEAGWAPDLVWTLKIIEKYIAPVGKRTPTVHLIHITGCMKIILKWNAVEYLRKEWGNYHCISHYKEPRFHFLCLLSQRHPITFLPLCVIFINLSTPVTFFILRHDTLNSPRNELCVVCPQLSTVSSIKAMNEL
jgi:hypothetical protein